MHHARTAPRRFRAIVASALAAALVIAVPVTGLPAAVAADPLEPVLVELSKDALPLPPGAAIPGETVTFTFTVTCSSTQTDCVNMVLTDSLPEPLEFVSVSSSTNYTIAAAPNGFELTFTNVLDEGGVGLVAGDSISFQATATVPSDVDASFDGDSIVNTAFVTVDNPDSNVSDEATVVLDIPLTISSSIEKTVSPSSVAGLPGTDVDFELEARNSSNTAVDELVIQDPAAFPSNAWDYLDVAALGDVTMPSGADRVRVDWHTASGWNTGTAAATATLPAVDLSTIDGLRFTFSSTTGQIARGATANVTIENEVTADALTMGGDFSGSNVASSFVTRDVATGTTVTDTAPFTIRLADLTPGATKSFSDNDIIGGRDLTVTLRGTNAGDFTVERLSVIEPHSGTDTLADQGLTFDSWVADDIEWPVGATSATVRYLHAGGYEPTLTVNAGEAFPTPVETEPVIGFRVDFFGEMLPNEYAVLPFVALSDTVATGNEATTNEIEVEVENASGDTASDFASDDLIRRSSRINTSIQKIFSPDEIYSVAGASALLALNAQVDPRPTGSSTGGSTVGVTSFTVRDDDADFFNAFDVAAIVATDVPSNATLTVRYFDGTSWIDLPGNVGLVGPQSVTSTIPAGLRDDIHGIEFVFTPTDADAELPPGFSVQPNVRVTLRDQLRDGSGDAADPDAATDRVLDNVGESIVENPVATPATATATDDDEITLLPVDGDGPAMLEKHWQTVAATGTDAVRARSGDRAIATIVWGTGGLDYDSVVITDAATDPATTPIEDTVFEAFNLRRIPAITTAMDPLLTYDRIEAVELYNGSAWVATAGNPCAGSACDGTFPGYTLTASEQASTIGVRFVIGESPTRAARSAGIATAPLTGTGVAASMAITREIDLEFEVRDTRRSNGDAVLGFTRGELYNLGDPGEVNNTALLEGLDSTGTLVYDDTAADAITILDRAINVSASKSWDDGPLGVPPTGTPQSLFPRSRITITAQNTSVVRVNELSLEEPTSGTNPFDFVNAYDIVSISVPAGTIDSSVVTLDFEGAPSEDFTITEAQNLTSADLADVVGISVSHEGRINSTATTTIILDTQLREFLRGTASTRVDETMTPVSNTVTATVTDPSGLTAPVSGTDNIVTDEASDDIAIEVFDFGVEATKSIVADTTATSGSPAIQYEDSATTALVTLTGQPEGNVRATEMVIEDSSPTFWNAYNFSAFGPGNTGTQSPINRVQVDALVGVTYDVDLIGNTITTLCDGDTDLTDCWILGSPATSLTMPALGANTNADVRGLRFTYTKADYSTWERPSNPLQRVSFTVERRDNLVAPSGEPVPSTYSEFTTAAPGETTVGEFTNDVIVTASSFETPSSPTPAWPSATDTDSKQIRFQHLPGRVSIQKTEFGAKSLGTDIPYTIIVKNTGGTLDRDLPNVVVTDHLPGDGTQPMLVIPDDPDTGEPYENGQAFTYSLRNASGVAQPAPTIAVVEGPASGLGRDLTFTMTSPATLPVGWTLTIGTTLRFVDSLEAGTLVQNTATVTSDRLFDQCDSFTDATTQKPASTFVADCTSDTTVWPLAAAPVSIVKGVRGVEAGPLDADGDPLLDGDGEPFDDLGILKTVAGSSVNCSAPNVTVSGTAEYYRYPCVPITRPGGLEEWASTFTNGGNIDITQLVAIDVLPTANDRGVIVNESRSSKWTPTLTTYPEVEGMPSGSSYSVYYVSTAGIATTRCNGADIQSELGMTASTSPPINPSYAACLNDTGRIDDVPNRDWQLLPAGTTDAALLASVKALKFVIDMPSGLAPGSRAAIVYQSRTAAAPEIAESAANLGRDSIAYNSIAGAAMGDDGGVEVPNRFVIEPRKVGVAMATGGIELEKLVTGAAADFAADDFELTLECESVGETVSIRNANGTSRNPFTITANAAATLIQGLPLYSECTVSEGDYGQTSGSVSPTTVTAQAAHTTTSLVFDPHPAFDDADGSYRPAIELASYTNEYELAGFTVSKSVNDGGAVDASGNPIVYSGFDFSAVCTFDNGDSTATVLNQTFTLTNTTTSRSFTGLPAGSSCTVTETTTRSPASTTYVVTTDNVAAASASGTAATFTLAPNDALDASTNAVAFTNTFAVGSLTVNKTVAGPGAAFGANSSFEVQIRCTRATGFGTPQPAVTFLRTVTFNATNGYTVTIPNIATGSSCAVTEPVRGGATSTSIPGAIVIGNGTTAIRGITNTFQLASLAVTKNVQQNAVDENGDPVDRGDFEMTVTCTFQGNAVWADGFTASPMVFSLEDTEDAADIRTRTLTGLPAGASCSIVEGATPGADSTDIAVRSATTSSVVTGKSATITLTPTTSTPATNTAIVTNRYDVTSFTVTKTPLGGGATQFGEGPFEIDVVCTAPGGVSAFDDTIELPTSGGAWFVTIEDLAEDSECSAIESNFAATGANAVVYRDGNGDPVAEGDTVLSTLATPGEIEIENWYLTGDISVTKTFAGAGSPQYSDGPFEVLLECERDGVAVTIPGGGLRELAPGSLTTTFELLPDGAECTLTEPTTGGATSSLIALDGGSTVSTDVAAGYTFTVDVDDAQLVDNQDQPALVVENTFDLASIDVTKTVESDAVNQDGDAVEYGPFPVTVDCTFEGDAVFADGFAGGMSFDIADGETRSLEGLPAGASCEVTETDATSGTPSITVTSGSSAPVTTTGTTAAGVSGTLVLAAGVNGADIVNSYDVGSLSLSKSVTGLGGDEWGTAEFTISVTCTLSDGSGIRNVWSDSYIFDSASDEVVIENLAEGAECDISEDLTGGADSTSIDIDGVVTAGTLATFTVTDSADPAVIVVTNVFPLSSVSVSKVIEGTGALLYGAGPFEVTLACTLNINGTDVALAIPGGATRSLDSGNAYAATFDDLPTGAVCSIDETETGGADATSIDNPSFTLDDAPTQVVVTNTFDTGAIAITKTIDGSGAWLYGNGPFEATVTCVRDVDGVLVPVDVPGGNTRVLDAANGYTARFEELPARADCSIVESITHGATVATSTADSAIVVADSTVDVGFTNTFEVAALSISKSVIGTAAGEHTNEEFAVEIACAMPIDRVMTDIPVPDGAERTFTAGETATWENLPVSAACEIDETENGGANAMVLSSGIVPLAGAVVTIDMGDTEVGMANVFIAGLAITGVDLMVWMLVATLLVALGLVLLVTARRRRSV